MGKMLYVCCDYHFAVVIMVLGIIVDIIRSSITNFVDRIVYSVGIRLCRWILGRLETMRNKYKEKKSL